MSAEREFEYLRRRLDEEREKAEKAADPAGYRAHTEFAREYERRLLALNLAHTSADS